MHRCAVLLFRIFATRFLWKIWKHAVIVGCFALNVVSQGSSTIHLGNCFKASTNSTHSLLSKTCISPVRVCFVEVWNSAAEEEEDPTRECEEKKGE